MAQLKIRVGGSLKDDLDNAVKAWRRSERGERVRERILSFESWEGLAKVMSGERYRLLRHLHRHPEASVSSLARSLKRQYRRVHADVTILERAGLLSRTANIVQATADRLQADIQL